MTTDYELQRYEAREAFMAVAVPVLGSEGARVLVAETNGTYLIGLEDYNHFSVEIISITKSLYDALIEMK